MLEETNKIGDRSCLHVWKKKKIQPPEYGEHICVREQQIFVLLLVSKSQRTAAQLIDYAQSKRECKHQYIGTQHSIGQYRKIFHLFHDITRER